MRVAIDSNVIISRAIFNSATMKTVIDDIATNHTLLIPSYVIDEVREVTARKWPSRFADVEEFLQGAQYEVIVTPLVMDEGLFGIRDPKDYPVLYSAMLGDADVLVTGDKDFGDVAIDRPEILTPAEYADKYVRR